MCKITVFTPTYNRAYIITKLYNSLKRQSFTDFEWLVVDDGSTDNTAFLFADWSMEETKFPIRYYKKENGGKCRAINYALDLAQGELFFTVDSDDYLTDDALEKVNFWESQLPNKSEYCGVAGNLGTSPNETPNTPFEGEFFEGNLLDRYKNVDGERAIVFYTDLHRRYKYPEFPGERFMTEAVVYNRIAYDGYKMRFYNDIIWVYEYISDGLTRSGNALFLNNPKGYGLWLKEKAIFEKVSWIDFAKICYTYTCELSTLYNPHYIAKCIDEPTAYIILLQLLRKVVHIIKRKT